jgi:uncharacterized membrane protein
MSSQHGSRGRRAYIDWARALAVLIMIEAHVLDAWTRAADRNTPLFGYAAVLGGFAAPLFLWLAGVALVLAATSVARRQGRIPAADAICRRGLEIFILAFLFRLQAFVLSPGSHPVTIFRVDILNVMGPSIALAGVIWGLTGSTWPRVLTFTALTAAVAMVTPIVRLSAAFDALPIWLQWYIRPAGEYTNFTAFPWAGFVLAGAAVGVLIADSRDAAAERRLHAALGVVGVVLVAAGLYTASLPTIYRRSFFWTSSPTYFAVRVGVMMVALALMFVLAEAGARRGIVLEPLQRFGRSSLFVYWIHVELVYGYASWLWRHRLPLWGTALGYVAFSVLLYRAIDLRDRVVDSWRAKLQRAPAVESASA